MDVIIEFDKSTVLAVIGQLAASGHEGRVKASLKRYRKDDSPGNYDQAKAALYTLIDGRLSEIKQHLEAGHHPVKT